MSSKSYFEIVCANVYWLVRGYRIDITRLSKRSFTWKSIDKEGVVVGRGKSSSAEGALRSAERYAKSLKAASPRKNWFARIWQWLKGNPHDQ